MQPLNPAYLLTFSSAMELGSFTAAAERAGMTQPAVSHQIRELERRLQLRLVERVGRRVMPTQAGRLLLEHTARIKLALDDAEAAMQQHANAPGGLVRIGTGATACIHLLPPVLRQLKRKVPQLDIAVSTGNTPEILRRVEDNTLDAALVTLPAAGRSLDIRPVVRDAFLAIAPRGQASMKRISPQALARQPLVLFERGANTRRLIDEWFGRAGCHVKPVMELGSVEAIKEMVAAGLGWSLLPQLSVATARLRSGLDVIPLAPGLERRLAWVMRRDKPLSRALGMVRDAVLGLQAASRAPFQ
ncbi:LysR family transcriptional regulator [Pigmentiphaga sp.]|uniref:LysR family transcriptional regulator n=1 Tax=Pigmentiphaga sp. TaxID=1977564 RepID=UPI0025D3FB2F|nr:LysR family transcriptional regulator [Pigmentiphaga sp.]MBX6318821.1 LysR family transcriptional regulator [Pigmentiphaga sp.]